MPVSPGWDRLRHVLLRGSLQQLRQPLLVVRDSAKPGALEQKRGQRECCDEKDIERGRGQPERVHQRPLHLARLDHPSARR